MKNWKHFSFMAIIAIIALISATIACDNGNGDDGKTEIMPDWRIKVTGKLTPALKTHIVNAVNGLSPAQQAYVKKNLTEIIIVEEGTFGLTGTVLTIRTDTTHSGISTVLWDWCDGKGISLIKEPDAQKAVKVATKNYIMKII
jgi:hypothetical protein